MSKTTIPAMKPARTPVRKGGKKLLALLLFFFVALLVVLFFQSSISKITEIRVEGQELAGEEEILEASGIDIGDHYFLASAERIAERVTALPVVDKAEVVKTFPGVITIRITEHPRVAFQMASDGTREVLLADGSVIPAVGPAASIPFDRPILTGWSADNPLKTELCRTLATIAPYLLTDISEIIPYPSHAYPDKIKLYTRSSYEVVTTIQYLPEKIQYLSYITNELKDRGKTTGIITMLETDRHAEFALGEDEQDS